MGAKTKIEWTRSADGSEGATWNPVTGCSRVSPACDHCYAETIAHRFAGTKAYPNGFDVTLRPERLDQPLRWTRGRKIFVNSMSDLFHADITDDYIAQVFAVMAAATHHTFQILTKRHGRMRSLLNKPAFRDQVAAHLPTWAPRAPKGTVPVDATDPGWWPLRNVWLGVSVENQQWANIRIPALLETSATVRFLSCEPLLGPVDLTGTGRTHWLTGRPSSSAATPEPSGYQTPVTGPRVDWVVAGGESGTGARPTHPDWVRTLRDQCAGAGVAFLFKQWGAWLPTDEGDPRYAGPVKGGYWKHDGTGWGAFTLPGVPQAPAWVLRLGKKATGRELDGRTWDEYPDQHSDAADEAETEAADE